MMWTGAVLSALSILLAGDPAEPLNVCLVSGSFEYESDASLEILQHYLESEYDTKCTLLKAAGWEDLPGLEALDSCDVALFFTRRLRISGEQLDRVKLYIESGRPFVAVRTASHGFQNWLEFDKKILGGSYDGHYNEGPSCDVVPQPSKEGHPILEGVTRMRSRGSLYKNENNASDVDVLMWGKTPLGSEPVAWTRENKGGRLFYTSLGAQGDFQNRTFLRMLVNALFWTLNRPVDRKPLPPVPEFPSAEGNIQFQVRTRVPAEGKTNTWEEKIEQVTLPVAETAILLCDMWDKHWCSGATERVDKMAPAMNEVVNAARKRGVQIIHCPSETMYFYADLPQRRRMQNAPPAAKPALQEVVEPKLPIDDSDGGCDTEGDEFYMAWSRQHPAIDIGEPDGISDNGDEVFNFCVQRGIKNIIYMGVHTNMCVLGRSFGIRSMSRLGTKCFLVRDMTDTMYDPKDAPHVSHEEGTELVVQHIEKYWCPSLLSDDLLKGLP